MTIFSDTDIVHHAVRTRIESVALSVSGEYPAISLLVLRNESGDTVEGIAGMWTDGECEPVQFGTYVLKGFPDTGSISADCAEAGLDPDAIEIPAQSGSVVSAHFRRLYEVQSTTGQTCGDWLAEWLTTQTAIVQAKGRDVVDFAKLALIFEANGLDMGAKWAVSQGSPGWQGRYRMNGRQVLAKRVALTGKVFDHEGNDVTPPKPFLKELRGKHAKWLAKQAKLADLAKDIAK